MTSRISKPTQNRADKNIFSVSAAMNLGSWLVCEHPQLWRRIARLESALLADQMTDVRVEAPIWITGLARSGSTLLLEILCGAPGVASHSYKDFPPVFTPYAWNRLLERMQGSSGQPTERAHQDGILVTADSPEAMEEPLWMSFFKDAHNPHSSHVILPGANPAFADFLCNHIRKLLLVKGASRYLSKANYQLTRMEYLLDVFPDARFVVPVRDPVMHIASLMKTHELFSRGQKANRKARAHLRRVGHFEFGLDRQPINFGDNALSQDIRQLWNDGEDIRAWALYWSGLYNYVVERVHQNKQLRNAVLFIHFERLCEQPELQLQQLLAHCALKADTDYASHAAARIKKPTYYKPQFNSDELRMIQDLTEATLNRLKQM